MQKPAVNQAIMVLPRDCLFLIMFQHMNPDGEIMELKVDLEKEPPIIIYYIMKIAILTKMV